jgi:hypothetical protein
MSLLLLYEEVQQFETGSMKRKLYISEILLAESLHIKLVRVPKMQE